MCWPATARAPSWPCPAHDSRDYAFARHFNLPIVPLIEGADVSEQSFDAKEGIGNQLARRWQGETSTASRLNGLSVKEAIAKTKAVCYRERLGPA